MTEGEVHWELDGFRQALQGLNKLLLVQDPDMSKANRPNCSNFYNNRVAQGRAWGGGRVTKPTFLFQWQDRKCNIFNTVHDFYVLKNYRNRWDKIYKHNTLKAAFSLGAGGFARLLPENCRQLFQNQKSFLVQYVLRHKSEWNWSIYPTNWCQFYSENAPEFTYRHQKF